MKKHNGMRPQDIFILLKIAALNGGPWYAKDLATSLNISHSEISESLHRSKISGLLAEDKKQLMRHALLDFFEHGIRYVFPGILGPIQRGMPTAHSALPLSELITEGHVYVWPWSQGQVQGQTVEPLYHTVPLACSKDNKLWELLSLVDALRIGKLRERNIAVEELKKRLL